MRDTAPLVCRRLSEIQPGAVDLTPLGVPEVEARQRHDPAETLVVLSDGNPTACCSVWTRETPRWNDRAVGVIGHFGATNPAAAARVLDEACQFIRNANLDLALGPIDGTTWRRYRLVTEQDPRDGVNAGAGSKVEAPFFLEPENPAAYVDYFTAAGFAPMVTYHSSITTDLATPDARAADAESKLADAGIRIRPMVPDRLDEELRRVYRLSVQEFADNPLYTPIDEAEFVATYRGVSRHLEPDLVLLAEREQELIGYVFALPDLAQARREEAVDRVVLKTMAVARDWRKAGLGGVLLDKVRRAAHAKGFRRAIYALMHDGNPSSRLADRFGTSFRRYAVFGRELGGGRS